MDLPQTLQRPFGVLRHGAGIRPFQNIHRAEQIRNRCKCFLQVSGNRQRLQKFPHPVYVFIGYQFPKLQFHLLAESGFPQKAFEKIHMPDAYLKFLQPGFQQRFRYQSDHLRIRFHTAVPDHLCPKLRVFLQSSLKIRMVDKRICRIAQADRHVLLRKILCHRSCNRRRDIRS